jgi:vesicle coat complex subunit
VLKKSLYQYITTYGTANSDLMLLTINMLLKDCQDQDPTIRGLALRSLCSLTISNLTEYLVSLWSQHGTYFLVGMVGSSHSTRTRCCAMMLADVTHPARA